MCDFFSMVIWMLRLYISLSYSGAGGCERNRYFSGFPQSWLVLFVPLDRWEMKTHRVKIALLGTHKKSMAE